MPRNLDHRVELAAPILAPELQAELLDTLERAFTDNQNSWEMDSAGTWTRRSPGPGERPRSMQLELAELYAGRGAEQRAPESRDVLAAGATDGVRVSRPRRVAEPTPWAVHPGSL
jgi:polyphosphate kinase